MERRKFIDNQTIDLIQINNSEPGEVNQVGDRNDIIFVATISFNSNKSPKRIWPACYLKWVNINAATTLVNAK